MVKIIRTDKIVTVIYSDGYSSSVVDDEASNIFKYAFFNQDNEEELVKVFKKQLIKKVSDVSQLEKLRLRYKLKKEENG